MALDRDGQLVWRKTVARGDYGFEGGWAQFKTETTPASPSPVTDGEHRFTLRAFNAEGLESIDSNVAVRNFTPDPE